MSAGLRAFLERLRHQPETPVHDHALEERFGAGRDHERLVPVEVEDLEPGQAGCWDRPRRARHVLCFRAELREDADELVALVRRHAAGAVSPRRLALVEETLLRGEELREYVERKYPRQSAPARERTYKRLQRERARTVDALREALAGWRTEYLGREAA